MVTAVWLLTVGCRAYKYSGADESAKAVLRLCDGVSFWPYD